MHRAYHPLALIGQVRARARRQPDRRIAPATPEPWRTVAVAEPEEPCTHPKLIGEDGPWRWETQAQRGRCAGMAQALQQVALQIAGHGQDGPATARWILFANGHHGPVRIEAGWTRTTHPGDDAMRAWAGLGEIEVGTRDPEEPAGAGAVEMEAGQIARIGRDWTHESVRRELEGILMRAQTVAVEAWDEEEGQGEWIG